MFFVVQLEKGQGAPPDLTWNKPLNSHAFNVKEFNVTFSEALKMVGGAERQLAAPHWSTYNKTRAILGPDCRLRSGSGFGVLCKTSARKGG